MTSLSKSVLEKQKNRLAFSSDNIEELNDDLTELKHQYGEMRKERLKSEKDEKLITNKMRLLSHEEVKVERKKQIEIYTQSNIEKIRVNLLHDREMLDEAKKTHQKELKKKQKKTKQLKLRINATLKNWRNQLEKHNKNEGKIVKREKTKIEEVIQLNQEELYKRNKTMHDNVQYYLSILEERKKKEEIDRKIKIKNELEERIKKEIAVKRKIDEKINYHQEQSKHIVERINSLSNLSLKPSLSRKDVFTLKHQSSSSNMK